MVDGGGRLVADRGDLSLCHHRSPAEALILSHGSNFPAVPSCARFSPRFLLVSLNVGCGFAVRQAGWLVLPWTSSSSQLTQ